MKSMSYQEFLEIKNSLSDIDKVRLAIEETPIKYWGKIYKTEIIEIHDQESNYPTFLAVSDTYKNNKRMRLIQMWYISKQGEAKPMRNRSIFIPDDYSDELSNILLNAHKLDE